MHHRMVVRLAAVGCALAAVFVAPGSAAKPPSHDSISYHGWTTAADFASGASVRVQAASVGNGAITLGTPALTLDYDDPFDSTTDKTSYDYGTWTSPVYPTPDFALTELVSSWTADTPSGTWIKVEMHGTTDAGTTTKWYVMGQWTSQMPSEASGDIHRTSVGGQGDADGFISIDTFFAAKRVALTDYQLRVTLYRKHGTTAAPTLRSVGAIASALPDDKTVPAGPLDGAEGMNLDVPQYSQEVHRGEFPEFDNGGEAWCSPTSTEMVVEYWGSAPSDLSGIGFADPTVDYAAMHTFDWHYDGAGNWPFNIGYAGSFGLEGEVVQLRSLTEAEQFIKAGIPLVASVAFKKNQLDNSGFTTNGHLLVIRGFTAGGDVIVNDPASRLIPDDAAVQNVYDRQQFADAWLPSSISGGIAYVIHPAGTALPANTPGLPANW
jgi:Peptidase_C39 like family